MAPQLDITALETSFDLIAPHREDLRNSQDLWVGVSRALLITS